SSRNKSLSTYHSSSPAFASSTSSSFSFRTSPSFFARAISPTRANLNGNRHVTTRTTPSSSLRFSSESTKSPGSSINFILQSGGDGGGSNAVSSNKKRACLCSPSTHPGSFRCALHKSMAAAANRSAQTVSYQRSSSGLNLKRSAMTNSLVRIGGVEGEWVKRALTALIRPSSHQQRRRAAFQPRPSRLSRMSKAEDL
ncbi:hypothetical protein CFOL_v3_04494, partial [Cephalotus follicularis]